MQAHLPSTETSTRRSGLSRWPTIVGLSLALALTVGIGLAQIRGGDSARTTERATVTDADHAHSGQNTSFGRERRPVVYIAATEEQANHALRFSAEINALRAELGQPLVSVGVIVAGPDSTLALDGLPGAPGTWFLDLRMP